MNEIELNERTFIFGHHIVAVNIHWPIRIHRNAYLTNVGVNFSRLKSINKYKRARNHEKTPLISFEWRMTICCFRTHTLQKKRNSIFWIKRRTRIGFADFIAFLDFSVPKNNEKAKLSKTFSCDLANWWEWDWTQTAWRVANWCENWCGWIADLTLR